MKVFIKVALLVMAGVVSQFASATGEEVKGKTTCTIFKQGKFVASIPCTYTGSVFGSIRFSGVHYDFKTKGYGNISTDVDSSADTDSQGEMREAKDGSVLMKPTTFTINKKKATTVTRNIKTLAVFDDTKVNEKNYKSLLGCMQAKDKSLEVCIPLKDGDVRGV